MKVVVIFCQDLEFPYTSRPRTTLATKVLKCWRSKWPLELRGENLVESAVSLPQVGEFLEIRMGKDVQGDGQEAESCFHIVRVQFHFKRKCSN